MPAMTRQLIVRALALGCTVVLAGCGYVVLPAQESTPAPVAAGGAWSAVATKVEEASGGLHVDLALRNDTSDWSAMQLADGATVTLVGSNGDKKPCATAVVGTGGTSLAPGFVMRGYTGGTKAAPETLLLHVDCEGAAPAPGSKLSIPYSYTSGEFNYYRPAPAQTATLEVDLDAPAADLTYPIGTPGDLAITKVGEPIEAINKVKLTLADVSRTADGIEFTWHTDNPTKYQAYVHIGIPPVIGSDGIIYGRYESPHLADAPITPANDKAEWTTSVAVPADVTGLYVLPMVESKQQKNFVGHAIDITNVAVGAAPASPVPSVALTTAPASPAPSVGVAPVSPVPSVALTTAPTSPAPSVGVATPALSSPAPSGLSERPEWFGLEMTDVRTGQPFTINDFAGKVVLLETMAVWCPTCRKQEDEVLRLHQLLGNPADLVSISLDTDMEEDSALLRHYAETLGYDWHIALAPLLVARALGNLYSAEYLNPPASPMLVIDRDGNVSGLPYGLKSAESLQGVVSPLLGP